MRCRRELMDSFEDFTGKQYGGEDNRRNERSTEVRNWRLAVVVFRDNVEIQWNVINTGLSNKLRSNVVLTELFADRAFLWCMNKVNGLPLDWWNENVFQRIRKKLGGLIGVANVTTDLTFIRYAKLRGKREPTTRPDSGPFATEGVAASGAQISGAPPNNATLGKSDHGYRDQHRHSAERRDRENLLGSSKRVGREVSFGGQVGRDSSTGTEIAVTNNTSTQSRELVPFVRIKEVLPIELIGEALEFYNENNFSALSLADDMEHLEEHWASAKAHRKDTISHVNNQHQNMDFQAHEVSNYFGQRTLSSISREKPSLNEADSLIKYKSPKLLSNHEEDSNIGKEMKSEKWFVFPNQRYKSTPWNGSDGELDGQLIARPDHSFENSKSDSELDQSTETEDDADPD
ncbi:hypothetical protein TorRG33x02_118310 [Trema orientale]|uniref:DUF4283 domain-containing protein n=1 Tax=Trema orientale TaxID=63057 RepID=A0A2P5F3F6_TREOI|nr:hypothetical protein TorRG33x02_118310 [Trema orientale]